MILKILIYLSIFMTISYTNNSVNDIYLGKWTEKEKEKEIIEINENNGCYSLMYSGFNLALTKKNGELYSTIYDRPIEITYNKQKDQLKVKNMEFIRFEKSYSAKVIGIWQIDTYRTFYVRITKDIKGRFIFEEGYKYKGKYVWTGEKHSLKISNGVLVSKFKSLGFRATHGRVVDYQLSLKINNKNELLYHLISSVVPEENNIGIKIETFTNSDKG